MYLDGMKLPMAFLLIVGMVVLAGCVEPTTVQPPTTVPGQVGGANTPQGTVATSSGDMSSVKSKLEALDTRLGGLETKVRNHNTPPSSGITVHFVTIENGKFYPDLIATYEGDNVKLNIINKDAVDHAFIIDALGGVNIQAPAGTSSGVKDLIPMDRKLPAGIYRFYSADVSDPRSGGYLVVLKS